MERFYVDATLTSHLIEIVSTEHHHLSRVMRLQKGDEIALVNGKGILGQAVITSVEKEKTIAKILSLQEERQDAPAIILGIPYMRPSKIEWVLEKGTEIGATCFALFPADQSTQTTFSAHQIERFRTITISALKQSGRLFLPHLEFLPDLSSLLEKKAAIFFGDIHPSAPKLMKETAASILFITGPESGFSEEEIKLLQHKGRGVSLSRHILRAETAPIVAISQIIVVY